MILTKKPTEKENSERPEEIMHGIKKEQEVD